MLVFVIEILVIILFFYVGFTQMIIPLWRDTPLFPFFRKGARLEHELKVVTEDVGNARLEREISLRTRAAANTRRRIPIPEDGMDTPDEPLG